jgi:hypothetical protein
MNSTRIGLALLALAALLPHCTISAGPVPSASLVPLPTPAHVRADASCPPGLLSDAVAVWEQALPGAVTVGGQGAPYVVYCEHVQSLGPTALGRTLFDADHASANIGIALDGEQIGEVGPLFILVHELGHVIARSEGHTAACGVMFTYYCGVDTPNAADLAYAAGRQ